VIVCRTEGERTPPGAYRTATGVASTLLGTEADPDDPELARAYFRLLYRTLETDRGGIQSLRTALNYPETARRFRMIDEVTESIVVRYGNAREQANVDRWLGLLRAGEGNPRWLLRRLQPFLVSLPRYQAEGLRARRLIAPVLDELGEWLGPYDPVLGIGTAIASDDPGC
jgi:CRISPR-associated endonuclease/helicase Cas3